MIPYTYINRVFVGLANAYIIWIKNNSHATHLRRSIVYRVGHENRAITWTCLITSSKQCCAKEGEQSIRWMLGKIGHLLILPPLQWTTCIAPLGHLIWLYVTFFFGDILSHVFVNQNIAPWITLRTQLERKFQ